MDNLPTRPECIARTQRNALVEARLPGMVREGILKNRDSKKRSRKVSKAFFKEMLALDSSEHRAHNNSISS